MSLARSGSEKLLKVKSPCFANFNGRYNLRVKRWVIETYFFNTTKLLKGFDLFSILNNQTRVMMILANGMIQIRRQNRSRLQWRGERMCKTHNRYRRRVVKYWQRRSDFFERKVEKLAARERKRGKTETRVPGGFVLQKPQFHVL